MSLTSETRPNYTRTRNDEAFRQICDLRANYGDGLTAHMLGIATYTVHYERQPVMVQRLASLLHRLTFQPGQPFTVFDLLTSGRYAVPAPIRQMPQVKPSCV